MTDSPGTIAIVGASSHRSKFGNKAVRAYLAEGWTVLPVNPNGGKIEGLAVRPNLEAIHEPLDRISVYLPPAVTLAMLPELAAAGASQVWFNPGSSNDVILVTARELGIAVRDGCSIVDIGRSPSEFREQDATVPIPPSWGPNEEVD